MTVDLKLTPEIEAALLNVLLKFRLAEGGRNSAMERGLATEKALCRRTLAAMLKILERGEPETVDLEVCEAVGRLRYGQRFTTKLIRDVLGNGEAAAQAAEIAREMTRKAYEEVPA